MTERVEIAGGGSVERAPIRELKRGHLCLVHLDPLRYSVVERMFIAAKVTRTFSTPDEIISEDGNAPGETPDERKLWWLGNAIENPRHDSVLEFAGLEYAVWVSGVSLGTIRDIDRHRRLSYEEYTTRALGESLRQHESLLRQAASEWQPFSEKAAAELYARVESLFYVHPAFRTRYGEEAVRARLRRNAAAVLDYLNACGDKGWDLAEDANRDVLPFGLRTPFLIGGNQRDLFEAAGKRTCFAEGHREYTEFFRALVELLAPVAPFLAAGTCRWCPQQKTREQCCRTAWARGVGEPSP